MDEAAQKKLLDSLRTSLSAQDLEELTHITSQQAFAEWKTNHPQTSISWQDARLLQTTQLPEPPIQEATETTQVQNKPHLPSSPVSQKAREQSYAKSLYEDGAYQNIVNNHLAEWRQQNPEVPLPQKTFTKDENGNLKVNSQLIDSVKNIDPTFDLERTAKTTYATAFGQERIDHYAQIQARQEAAQQAEATKASDYESLKEAIRTNPAEADRHYRSFFAQHKDVADLSADDWRLRKAYRSYSREQRQQEKERQDIEVKRAREEERVRKTIYRDEKGMPTLEKDPAYQLMQQRVSQRTNKEISEKLKALEEEDRRLGRSYTREANLRRIDSEGIQKRISHEELQSVVKTQDPKKIARYAKYNPTLGAAIEEVHTEEKKQREQMKEATTTARNLQQLSLEEHPTIKRINQTIEQRTQAEYDRQQDLIRRTTAKASGRYLEVSQSNSIDKEEIRKKIATEVHAASAREYEQLVRDNPALAANASTNAEIQAAKKRVTEAQTMARRRGIVYRLRQGIKKTRFGRFLSEKKNQFKKTRFADGIRLINKRARDNFITRAQTRSRNWISKVFKGAWSKVSRGISFANGSVKAVANKTGKALYNSRPVQFLLRPFKFAHRQLGRLTDGIDRLNNRRFAYMARARARMSTWFKNTRMGSGFSAISQQFNRFKKWLSNNRLVKGLRSAYDLVADPAAFARQQLKNLAKNVAKRFGKRLASAGLKLAARGLGALASGGASALASLGGAALSGAVSALGAAGAAISAVAGAVVAAAPAFPIVLVIICAIGGVVILWCVLFGCSFFGGKPSTTNEVGIAINKSGPEQVANKANITYNINVSYTSTASEVTVKDQLDPNVDFVQANGPGNPTYDQATHTVTWTIVGTGTTGSSPGSGSPAPPGVNVLPNQETCDGVYTLTGNERNGENFGDPTCDLAKTPLVSYSFRGHSWQVRKGLLDLLQQLDPDNVGYWLGIAECESGIDPNDVTPAVNGIAYGLFQMGARIVNGQESPYGEGVGLNGKYDRGDVNWRNQVSNAVNYNKQIGGSWRYWACASIVWGLW